MKIQLENDYVDVNSDDCANDCEVAISEQGVYVSLDARDYEEPYGERLRLHASVGWDELIEEALKEAVDACRDGIDGSVHMDELIELRDQWIVTLEKFVDRLRALP